MGANVVLVGGDAAPSGCFKRLMPILQQRGFGVNLFVGNGKPFETTTNEVEAAASCASVVVLGMSSPKLAQFEIAAGIAASKANMPFGFYGDARYCWGRAREGALFNELAHDAAFYFGVTQEDSYEARAVFPNAKLIGTGNPLREEMAFPRFTREEVRAKLNITSEEILVLVSGGTFAAGNMASWVVIIEAIQLLTLGGRRFQVVFAVHPGDRTPYAVDSVTNKEMKLYDELISFSPIRARMVGKNVLTTSNMVPGADIIVEFGSAIGIEGAYQGVPVVTLSFEILFGQYEEANGTRVLETVEDGLSELVMAEPCRLTDAIGRLLTPEGFAKMRARQKELCPKPEERGAALRKMADAIAQFA